MARYRGPLVDIEVVGGDRFRRLALQLRDAGEKELLKELRKGIRAAGRPVVADVQRAYRTLPDVSPAARVGAQARATIAKAVRLEIRAAKMRAGIRIVVDSRKLPADMRSLPKAFESARGWRHPVYGRAAQTRTEWTWAHQQMPPPFRRTVRRHERDFRAACLDAMERVARDLNGR
jgi:hypothetical protein